MRIIDNIPVWGALVDEGALAQIKNCARTADRAVGWGLLCDLPGGTQLSHGRWLGLGMRYGAAEARHMSEDTVEWAETAAAIRSTVDAMIDGGTLDGAVLPLMAAILDMVCCDAPVDIPWDRFFVASTAERKSPLR